MQSGEQGEDKEQHFLSIQERALQKRLFQFSFAV